MSIKENLLALDENKNELLFMEISKEETQAGDLTVRDQTGLKPLYFRQLNFEQAFGRITRGKQVTVIKRESELGKLYLQETKGNNDENS